MSLSPGGHKRGGAEEDEKETFLDRRRQKHRGESERARARARERKTHTERETSAIVNHIPEFSNATKYTSTLQILRVTPCAAYNTLVGDTSSCSSPEELLPRYKFANAFVPTGGLGFPSIKANRFPGRRRPNRSQGSSSLSSHSTQTTSSIQRASPRRAFLLIVGISHSLHVSLAKLQPSSSLSVIFSVVKKEVADRLFSTSLFPTAVVFTLAQNSSKSIICGKSRTTPRSCANNNPPN